MTQIIPCNVEMYAVFREEDGEETRSRVLAFGLHHDCCGDVVPLIFDPVLGISETNLMHFVRYEITEVTSTWVKQDQKTDSE